MPNEEHDQDRTKEAPDQPAGAPADRVTAEAGDHSVVLSRSQYEELKTLARERDEYLRRLQRAVADYQNLQKRMEKWRASARTDMVRSLTQAVLPVADSLSLALSAARETDGADRIVEGLELVEEEFYAALATLAVRPIQAVGARFDPHYHEAVFQQDAADAVPMTVLSELKKGFLLGETVIRPSQVVVASPKSGSCPHRTGTT